MEIKPISWLDLFHSQCNETHALYGAVTRIMARPKQQKDCTGGVPNHHVVRTNLKKP